MPGQGDKKIDDAPWIDRHRHDPAEKKGAMVRNKNPPEAEKNPRQIPPKDHRRMLRWEQGHMTPWIEMSGKLPILSPKRDERVKKNRRVRRRRHCHCRRCCHHCRVGGSLSQKKVSMPTRVFLNKKQREGSYLLCNS